MLANGYVPKVLPVSLVEIFINFTDLFFAPSCLGGNIRFHGEKGEGGIYLGTDETLYCCEGLHSHPDHQQEDKHKILSRGGY